METMTFNFGEIYVQSDGVAVLFSKLLPWLIIYQALRFFLNYWKTSKYKYKYDMDVINVLRGKEFSLWP